MRVRPYPQVHKITIRSRDSDFIVADSGSAGPLNNVEVIRRLTTLSFGEQEKLLAHIGQQLNIQEKLSVKDIVELIKSERKAGNNEYQLSFVDLGLDELNLFHQWTKPERAENKMLSVGELDRLIELYEKDLSKLRQVRANKETTK